MVDDSRTEALVEPFRPIATDRLILRCVRDDDAAILAALMTPRISRRLASWPARLTTALARERIRDARDRAWAGQAVPLALERRGDGAFVGWFAGACQQDDPTIASLTYWLGEPFHGTGLMREAAPVALALTLERLPVRRVRAAVQAENDPSLAVVRQLGMRSLGSGRIWCSARGREETCLWFDLAREDAGASAATA